MNTNTIPAPQLHVGRGTTHGALTVFPVWVEGPSIPRIEWRPDGLRVAERAGSPIVGELVVENPSPRPAVLLEGDVLEGGWQNRMVADEQLLAPGASSVVPVRCVERHRWHGIDASPAAQPGDGRRGSSHVASGRRSPYSVRFGVTTDATGRPDQTQVWNRVERFEQAFGRTGTASLVEHLRRPAPRFASMQGQRGVIIGIGGRVIAAEVFGSRSGFARRLNAITDAAWLDAQSATASGAPAIATPGWAARDFAAALGGTRLDVHGLAGVGLRVASTHGRLRARGLSLVPSHEPPVAPEVFEPLSPFPHGAPLVHLAAVDAQHPVLARAAG